jgi:cytochrome c biogenesis protein CcmG, thiol:disulfide interchange protein DsbE
MRKVFVGAILILIISVNLSAQETNFKIKTIDNSRVELKELYSKGAVLVNFWALWCEPCRVEMKYLNAIYEKYKDKGFTILGINQDSPKSVSKVRSYISSQKINYPVALDPNAQYLQKLNGQSVPYSLLYDSNGKLVYKHSGFLPGDEAEIEKHIEETLSGKN